MSIELFSLGKIYPSDFLKPGEKPRSEPIELKLIMSDNGLVHLEKTAPKEVMWGKYWYRSGINQTMKSELKNIVYSILPLMKFKENDIFCDVACNDGSLLSFVPKSFIRIGIDPADDSFKKESEQHADLIIQDYFSANVYKQSAFGNQKIKVLTSIAMFYDLENPKEFIDDVYEVLDDDGLWVMQLSYSPLMMRQIAFDNIVHEHYAYYSLFSLSYLLSRSGFSVVDCQLNDINGGSFRIYIMKSNSNYSLFGTQPYRDVCRYRTESIAVFERDQEVNTVTAWRFFFDKIKKLNAELVGFIRWEKKRGKSVWAYGASTKGNTLLQYFHLNWELIDGIAERNIDKWGLRTVGTDIPIFSESDMRKAKPDYLLLLPWHFLSEFKEREKEYLQNGGKFIVPCPKFEIIGL